MFLLIANFVQFVKIVVAVIVMPNVMHLHPIWTLSFERDVLTIDLGRREEIHSFLLIRC